MKNFYSNILSLAIILAWGSAFGQTPDQIYYKFDETGTSVTNEANPGVGNAVGTITGTLTQGSTGVCNSALVGTGSTTSGVSTGYSMSPGTSDWTLSFWTSNITPSTTLWYIFGDLGYSFRCFTNGVAGANNWMLRGTGITDVTIPGGATTAPNMIHFVYDSSIPAILGYLDGVLVTTVNQTLNLTAGTGLTVGGYGSSSGLSGLMDEFRLYSYALTPAQVAASVGCLSSPAANDAGVQSLITPTLPTCAGTYPVKAVIKNYGINQVDSVLVNWTINGVAQTTLNYTSLLDTLNGSGSDTAHVVLGTVSVTGPTNIQIYTSLPNNIVDTSNANDTLTVAMQPALAGTYVIGSSAAADYSDFQSAVSDLVNFGVCSSVVFEVENGTYNEQIEIPSISGASSTNSITFRSESLDSSLVVLTFASTGTADNYVIRLNGADHINIEHMTLQNTGATYAYVLDFLSGADSNSVSNCHLTNNNAGTSTLGTVIYSGTSIDEFNSFTNNLIEGGSYGVYFYGTSTVSLARGIVFENNTFLNQYFYGARFYYLDAPQFRNNTMTSNSAYTSGYGMYFGYCDNEMLIESNHLYTSAGSEWPLYGLYVYYCDGSVTAPGKTINNVISLGTATTGSAASYYGFYPYYNDFQSYVNNTIILRNGGTGSKATYLFYCDFYDFVNNISVNYGSGDAVDFNYGSGPNISDNNAFYGATSNSIEWGAVTTISTISELQQNSGFDFNSFFIDPVFSDDVFGEHCSDSLNNAGVPFAGVTHDFYGTTRNVNTPDIGAIEYQTAGSFSLGPDTTMCGDEYTIDTYSPTGSIQWVIGGSIVNATSYTFTATNLPGIYSPVYAVYTSPYSGICAATVLDTVNVTVVPNANLDDSLHLCANVTETLISSTGSPAASYHWLPGNQTTQSINVDHAGIFILTKVELGCTSQELIIVSQTDPLDIQPLYEACVDDLPYQIDATIDNGSSYSWTGGLSPNDPINTFNTAGSYTLVVNDAFNCSEQVDFEFDIIDAPAPIINETHGGFTYIFTGSSTTNVGANATYSWIFSDEPTVVYTGQTVTHTFPFSGSGAAYNVSLTILNECNSGNENTIIQVDPLGVNDLAGAENVRIYPNPTNNFINVALDQPSTEIVAEITDLAGRSVMLTQQNSTSAFTLDLSNISAGTYVLKIVSDRGTTVKSIIKN